ncbi:hypothetical protein Moror_2721 [Moniliophthora roreri MCA 2997]|uniref:Uncharacterized protein n=1 Tax=Moniliophthora roreri (strain MCA 2997) TaxID=1381753 RepID=V2YI51_MONRO|nr:hypothetical protein Moror_2721 [Moniliophthora roreri MCA 2997]
MPPTSKSSLKTNGKPHPQQKNKRTSITSPGPQEFRGNKRLKSQTFDEQGDEWEQNLLYVTEKLNDLHGQVKDLKALLKQKDSLLKDREQRLAAADLFTNTTDRLTEEEIIEKATSINIRVERIASQIANSPYFEFTEAAEEGFTHSVVSAVGQDAVSLLQSLAIKDTLFPVVRQIALQCRIVQGLVAVAGEWSSDDDLDRRLQDIYEEMMDKENLVIAQSWKALTKARLRGLEDPKHSALDSLISDISSVLVVAGMVLESSEVSDIVRAKFGTELQALVDSMLVFESMMTKHLKSKQLEIFCPNPRDLFDPGCMQNEEKTRSRTQDIGDVFLPVSFGLKQKNVVGDVNVLLKSKVYRYGTFKKEIKMANEHVWNRRN